MDWVVIVFICFDQEIGYFELGQGFGIVMFEDYGVQVDCGWVIFVVDYLEIVYGDVVEWVFIQFEVFVFVFIGIGKGFGDYGCEICIRVSDFKGIE